jgi:hypothetical protein
MSPLWDARSPRRGSVRIAPGPLPAMRRLRPDVGCSRALSTHEFSHRPAFFGFTELALERRFCNQFRGGDTYRIAHKVQRYN